MSLHLMSEVVDESHSYNKIRRLDQDFVARHPYFMGLGQTDRFLTLAQAPLPA